MFNFSFGPCFYSKIDNRINEKIIHIKSLNFNEKIIDLFRRI